MGVKDRTLDSSQLGMLEEEPDKEGMVRRKSTGEGRGRGGGERRKN